MKNYQLHSVYLNKTIPPIILSTVYMYRFKENDALKFNAPAALIKIMV